MKFIRENIEGIVYAYIMASIMALFLRLGLMDCEHRYVDYVLPASKIHCKI